MQANQIHTCPECLQDFDLTITLGIPMFFNPDSCPHCKHEIDQEEVEDTTEEDQEWHNPYYR